MNNSDIHKGNEVLNFQDVYDKFVNNDKEFKFTFKAFSDFFKGEIKKSKLPLSKIQSFISEVKRNYSIIGNENLQKINHQIDKEHKKLDYISAQIKDKMREETVKSIKLKSSKAQYDEIINQHRIEKESIENTINFLLSTVKDIHLNMESLDEKIVETKNLNSHYVSKDYNYALEISEEEKIINTTESQINCHYQEYNNQVNDLNNIERKINEIITHKQNFNDKVLMMDEKIKESINLINQEKVLLQSHKQEASDYIKALISHREKDSLNNELTPLSEYVINKVYYFLNYGKFTAESSFKEKCFKRLLLKPDTNDFDQQQINLKYEEEKKLKSEADSLEMQEKFIPILSLDDNLIDDIDKLGKDYYSRKLKQKYYKAFKYHISKILKEKMVKIANTTTKPSYNSLYDNYEFINKENNDDEFYAYKSKTNKKEKRTKDRFVGVEDLDNKEASKVVENLKPKTNPNRNNQNSTNEKTISKYYDDFIDDEINIEIDNKDKKDNLDKQREKDRDYDRIKERRRKRREVNYNDFNNQNPPSKNLFSLDILNEVSKNINEAEKNKKKKLF